MRGEVLYMVHEFRLRGNDNSKYVICAQAGIHT
jgi:hypothetical protein